MIKFAAKSMPLFRWVLLLLRTVSKQCYLSYKYIDKTSSPLARRLIE